MKTWLALSLMLFGSLTHASVCDEVERRIGDEKVFQHFVPNAATAPLVQLHKTGDHQYSTLARGESGGFALKSYVFLCVMKPTAANPYFSADKTWFITIPNARGECWVSMARISKLVPDDQEAEFIKGGFCVSPFSYDPETSWVGTSVMTPARLSL